MSAQPEEVAIADLYSEHHSWLQGLVRRRIGCSETAADVAQDVFVRFMRNPRRFDSTRGARAYLGAMARGLCIDLLRRRELEQAWLDELAARPEAMAPSAEHRAVVLETLFEVDAMLRRLPDNVAHAFIASQIHGRTYRRIAGDLGVSERMVKKYMARAMLQCALVEAGLDAHA